MALPAPLRSSTAPAELELIASEELIDIVPSLAMDKTAFISGAYGPLRPPTKCRVPLWMATNLKLKRKCRIVQPDWLTVEHLQDSLTEETAGEASTAFSAELPFRYAEMAKILLDIASDDLYNPEKIRSLLKDIREARQAKTRERLQKLDHNELKLPHLCSMEVNEIRPFFVRAMKVLTELSVPPDA